MIAKTDTCLLSIITQGNNAWSVRSSRVAMQTTARRLVFDGSCAGSATDEVAVLPPAASTHSVAPPQQAWAPCTTDDLDTGGCVTPSVETNARESADKPAYGADSGATSVPAPGSSADLQPSSLPSSDMQATKDSDPPSAAARRPPRPIPQALLGLLRWALAACLRASTFLRNFVRGRNLMPLARSCFVSVACALPRHARARKTTEIL